MAQNTSAQIDLSALPEPNGSNVYNSQNDDLAVIELAALHLFLVRRDELHEKLKNAALSGEDLYNIIINSKFRRRDLEYLLPPSSRTDRKYAVVEIKGLIKKYEIFGFDMELLNNCQCLRPELLRFLDI